MTESSASSPETQSGFASLGQAEPTHFDRAQIWLVLALLLIAISANAIGGINYLTGLFLSEQDVLVAGIVIVGGLLVSKQREGLAKLWNALIGTRFLQVWIIAGLVLLVALGGTFLVFSNYPLSLDEFWARADGAAFARGVPLAQIPQEWRSYGEALQPIFTRLVPDEGLWASTYLPVNALLQWLGGPVASPLMAAASVVMIALIARRLFPDEPFAPALAAILLATSAQTLLTAMTPYSMTAHLLFDLVWLWLFLQRRMWAYLASLVIAALAMGLHQEAFFPLFALPFLLERFLTGQRLFAVLYVICIGAGFLAWNSYDLFVYGWFDASPPVEATTGSDRKLADLFERLTDISSTSVATMAANLTRFTLWQNPMVMPLLVLVAWPVARLANGAPPELRAMLLSIVGSSLFLLLVIPYQGHGWGYRYLHGQMGGAVLIATFAFCRFAKGPQAAAWRGTLAGMTAIAVLLIPVRTWQAHDFTAPYAAADAALSEWQGTEVIVIDAPRFAYTIDLTRNDLWLENPIKRVAGANLTTDQLATLCELYSVRFFTDDDAEMFGIRELPETMRREATFPQKCPG